jgi:hypothetical protein
MLVAESVLGTVVSLDTSLFFLSVCCAFGGSFSRMHPFQQHVTVRHLEYLTAPKIPRHRVVTPPIIARMSAVLVTTFPIFFVFMV